MSLKGVFWSILLLNIIFWTALFYVIRKSECFFLDWDTFDFLAINGLSAIFTGVFSINVVKMGLIPQMPNNPYSNWFYGYCNGIRISVDSIDSLLSILNFKNKSRQKKKKPSNSDSNTINLIPSRLQIFAPILKVILLPFKTLRFLINDISIDIHNFLQLNLKKLSFIYNFAKNTNDDGIVGIVIACEGLQLSKHNQFLKLNNLNISIFVKINLKKLYLFDIDVKIQLNDFIIDYLNVNEFTKELKSKLPLKSKPESLNDKNDISMPTFINSISFNLDQFQLINIDIFKSSLLLSNLSLQNLSINLSLLNTSENSSPTSNAFIFKSITTDNQKLFQALFSCSELNLQLTAQSQFFKKLGNNNDIIHEDKIYNLLNISKISYLLKSNILNILSSSPKDLSQLITQSNLTISNPNFEICSNFNEFEQFIKYFEELKINKNKPIIINKNDNENFDDIEYTLKQKISNLIEKLPGKMSFKLFIYEPSIRFLHSIPISKLDDSSNVIEMNKDMNREKKEEEEIDDMDMNGYTISTSQFSLDFIKTIASPDDKNESINNINLNIKIKSILLCFIESSIVRYDFITFEDLKLNVIIKMIKSLETLEINDGDNNNDNGSVLDIDFISSIGSLDIDISEVDIILGIGKVFNEFNNFKFGHQPNKQLPTIEISKDEDENKSIKLQSSEKLYLFLLKTSPLLKTFKFSILNISFKTTTRSIFFDSIKENILNLNDFNNNNNDISDFFRLLQFQISSIIINYNNNDEPLGFNIEILGINCSMMIEVPFKISNNNQNDNQIQFKKSDIIFKTIDFLNIDDFKLILKFDNVSNVTLLNIKFIINSIILNYSITLHFLLMSFIHLLLNLINSPFGYNNLMGNKKKNINNNTPNNKGKKIHVSTCIESKLIDLKFLLPTNFQTKLIFNNLKFFKFADEQLRLLASNIYILVESPIMKKEENNNNFENSIDNDDCTWNRFLCLNEASVDIGNKVATQNEKDNDAIEAMKNDEDDKPKKEILASFTWAGLFVPHDFIFHRLFDSITLCLKTIKQLNHSLKTNSIDSILIPVMEPPKALPTIRLKSKQFKIIVDDDPFESRLSLIYQIGLSEQKNRLLKLNEFEIQSKKLLDIAERLSTSEKQRNNSNASHPLKTSRSFSNLLKRAETQYKFNSNDNNSNSNSATNININDNHDQSSLNTSYPSNDDHDLNDTSSLSNKSNKSNTSNGNGNVSASGKFKYLHRSATRLRKFSSTNDLNKVVNHSQSQDSNISHNNNNNTSPYNSTTSFNTSESNSVEEALKEIQNRKQVLYEHLSTSWIKRIQKATMIRKEEIESNSLFLWGSENANKSFITDNHDDILQFPYAAPLIHLIINDLNALIRKPLFNLSDGLCDFLNDVGKNLPKETEFSLCLPLFLLISFGEARFHIRDYPLPMVHIPKIHSAQPQDIPGAELRGHIVVAEEMITGIESIRKVFVPLVPSAIVGAIDSYLASSLYSVTAQRTIGSVKMYIDFTTRINSRDSTQITWGQSYQPAIQDLMRLFDNFSKPQLDPSDKIGFWDKLRMIFHGKLNFNWPHGDVQVLLKGSRNPYEIIGKHSGFALCFQKNVKIAIHETNNPKELLMVSSYDILLAIPNYSINKLLYWCSDGNNNNVSYGDFTNGNITANDERNNGGLVEFLDKIVMRLSGGVKFIIGVVLERDDEYGHRVSTSIPHYAIKLKHPDYVDDISKYDAYKGFRSQYIHLAFSIISPPSDDWKKPNIIMKPEETSYNALYLTPGIFSHFFHWCKLFGGNLALPVRHGNLFKPEEKPTKKFVSHLYTIKYQLLLSPLYVSHVYHHAMGKEDFKNDMKFAATGIKAKVDSFFMDLHQRKQKVTYHNSKLNITKKLWAMRFDKGEVNLFEADIRGLSGSFEYMADNDNNNNNGNSEIPKNNNNNNRLSYIAESSFKSIRTRNTFVGNHSELSNKKNYRVFDNDFSWVDLEDFVEIGNYTALSPSVKPMISVVPLIFTPRFSYIRQTDGISYTSKDKVTTSPADDFSISGNPYDRSNELKKNEEEEDYDENIAPFGDEPSHDCHIGLVSFGSTQQMLLEQRIKELENGLFTNLKMLQAFRENLVKSPDEDMLKSKIKEIETSTLAIQQRLDGYNIVLNNVTTKWAMKELRGELKEDVERADAYLASIEELQANEQKEKSFHNRFTLHNVLCKWNQDSRDLILRYLHHVNMKKSMSYYATYRAINQLQNYIAEQTENEDIDIMPFIESLDINEDNEFEDMLIPDSVKASGGTDDLEDNSSSHYSSDLDETPTTANFDKSDNATYERRMKSFEPDLRKCTNDSESEDTYSLKLISPQIQLLGSGDDYQNFTSSDDPECENQSCMIVYSQSIQASVISIFKKGIKDMAGLIETRYGVTLREAQVFIVNKNEMNDQSILHFRDKSYGAAHGRVWPPWLANELCYDFRSLKSALIASGITACLRYDDINQISSKSDSSSINNDSSLSIDSGNQKPNKLSLFLPKVTSTFTSEQFTGFYDIVVNLLIYSDPSGKEIMEKLTKIMLATDFRELTDAPARIQSLQTDINEMKNIKSTLSSRRSRLSPTELSDYYILCDNLQRCHLELFLMMEAITKGIQKQTHDNHANHGIGTVDILEWLFGCDQVICHIVDKNSDPLIDLAIAHGEFKRVESSDGSDRNAVNVRMLQGFNLSPNALYPELLSPYYQDDSVFSIARGIGSIITEDNDLVRIQWKMLEPIGGIKVIEYLNVIMKPLKVQLDQKSAEAIFEFAFPAIKNMGNNNNNSPNGNNDTSSPNSIFENNDVSKSTPPIISISEDQDSDVESDLENSDEDSISQTSENEKPRPYTKSLFSLNVFDTKNTATQSQKQLQPSSRSVKSKSSIMQLSQWSSSSMSVRDVGSSTSISNTSESEDDKDDQDYDISKMISRASNYLSILQMNIPSVVLCLSYNGNGLHRLVNVHEFVFTLPELNYENKTWAVVDIVKEFRNDVLKTLLSHTGQLLGNKMKRHNIGHTKISEPLKQLSTYGAFTTLQELREASKTVIKNRKRRSMIKEEPALNLISPPRYDEIEVSTSTSTYNKASSYRASSYRAQLRSFQRKIRPSSDAVSIYTFPSKDEGERERYIEESEISEEAEQQVNIKEFKISVKSPTNSESLSSPQDFKI